MSADHDDQTPGQKILEEIAAIPAIWFSHLRFVRNSMSFCELRGFTYHQLVVEAALTVALIRGNAGATTTQKGRVTNDGGQSKL
jgi:hypothetical protein